MAELSTSTVHDESLVHQDDSAITRRLRAQYTEIAQLAGGLAHEIKNPLSTMSLNLDLLVEDFRGAETTRDKRVLQKLERVRRETDRLQDIVEDFLRFAKVQDLTTVPTDLNAVVDDLRDFCEPQAVGQGVLIRTQYDPDLPLVPLDVDLFKQALWNLIRNAQHAMPDGGELILQTRLEGDCSVLDVTDTGVGMSEEVASRVFDTFYSTRPGGSGLGLPTTRKVVEAHGGSISLQSAPGQGSRFTIRLPLAEGG
ncbi:sensor histidine kinase [Tundrisphaera lichenicola]|uniref:sensor histidine kinase n=1 Tax=Tundrisphaera lichenicola TaxID=2029860 RepID=UPI003EB74CE9